jgi:hypothetical protein
MNVEFNKKIMEELMEELKDKRPVFNSEDDFKFSLAWLIKEKYRDDVEIRLEKKMNNNKDASSSEAGDQKNKNQRIDIFIIVKNENDMEKIGIELKYFTAKIEWRDNKNEETFILAEQAANDIKCYDAWKDVERLEDFIDRDLINRGFVIWLTNVNSLTKDPTETKKRNNNTTYYDEFKIFNGREINGPKILEWDKKASQGTIKGRDKPITIKGNYKVCWKVYVDLSNGEKNIDGKRPKNKESKMVFKYAILEVQKKAEKD